MQQTSLAIHGGAGTLVKSAMSAEKEKAYTDALAEALAAGNTILLKGGSSLDAVEAAVRSMEDCPLFNAGRGSVYTSDGKHEMDASIMCGQSRKAGAVCAISGIKNPVTLARRVMEKTEHVMLVGKGAETFAQTIGAETADAAYFHDDLRYRQWKQVQGSDRVALDHDIEVDKKFGTVGAVALDSAGNIAAATSTGGMTNKMYGRVGDSSIIGAGCYANNATCAISCTGSGEYFIRGVVAYDVSALMEFSGLSLQEACDKVVHERLMNIEGDGGLIAVDAQGEVAMVFNTEGMYRASAQGKQEATISIYR